MKEWVECKNCFSTFLYEPKKPANGVFKGLHCIFCGSKIPSVIHPPKPDGEKLIEDRLITEILEIGFVDLD